MSRLRRKTYLCLVACLILVSCTTSIPKDALILTPESLADRQMQTRVFDTSDEKKLVLACSGVLQDTGFQISESETKLGVLVATRDRDVTEAGAVIGAAIVAGLFGTPMTYNTTQKVRASVVTKPLDNSRISVRVTFQHIVWNNQNIVTKAEQINDQEIYEEFFAKLGKSVFLEAEGI